MLEGKDNPRQRRENFAKSLRENRIDVAIVSNPKHTFYFTGFASNLNMYLTLMKGPRSTSFLGIRSDGQASILLGKSEVDNPWSGAKDPFVRNFGGEVVTYVDYDRDERIVSYGDSVTDEFSKWLRGFARGYKRIGVEEWHLSESYCNRISNMLAGPDLVGISRSILEMRKTKGKDEIASLKSATKMLDFAFSIAKRSSKPGLSELDVYREMNYFAFKEYGPFGWIMGDLVSGKRSLEVGGWATPRKLKRGDTIVLDLQASCNNYWSDLCRTFVVGIKPNKAQKLALTALTDSLERAKECMKPGTQGSDVYKAVNDAVVRAGFPNIPHHVGHSIGLDDQELPWLVSGSKEELEEGMVCVVEPGIYTKPTGGIRLEDAFLITKKGAEKISHFPLSLN
ncbi:MAG TPA: Xaa-Pro peptidase family protein [Nitrososphaerales archaeon]|nr:Xaa-Pro peptidase family protein [Nitrososphaerales archaeon]